MIPRKLVIVNKRFGSLFTLKQVESREDKTKTGHQAIKRMWLCRCDCGEEKIIQEYHLASGSSTACGYCKGPNHRLTHPEAYNSWRHMKERCDNPNTINYKNYGGRGITYDSSWKDFTSFYRDMGDPPICPYTLERLSLDRIDNNKNYSKENCRWADLIDQANNKRR